MQNRSDSEALRAVLLTAIGAFLAHAEGADATSDTHAMWREALARHRCPQLPDLGIARRDDENGCIACTLDDGRLLRVSVTLEAAPQVFVLPAWAYTTGTGLRRYRFGVKGVPDGAGFAVSGTGLAAFAAWYQQHTRHDRDPATGYTAGDGTWIWDLRPAYGDPEAIWRQPPDEHGRYHLGFSTASGAVGDDAWQDVPSHLCDEVIE